MKNKFFRTMFGLSWLVIFALITFTSCEKDDDNGDDEEPILVEDGLYIVGPATPFSDLDPNGALLTTKNEVVQEERAELKDIYISLKGGENFHIESVAGAERQTWGPGADFAVVPEAERDIDEPKVDFWRGSIEEGTATFTVPNDGLYHIAMDTELNVVVVAPVQWGVIGAATPNGWGSSTPLELQEFNQDAMTFEKSEVIMVVGDYKFRYSDGWKINLDTEYDLGGGNTGIKVNTNYGGTLDNLVPGGDNMSLEENGVYTVSVTWSLEEGISATVTKTGDYTPPSFPEAMYIVGAGTAYGWDEPGTVEDAIMHKAAGGSPMEGVFWKICHIEAGQGFKLSAEAWGDPNLGFAEVDEYDANGVAVSEIDGNMDIAESGMYMVVVDLRDDMTKVSIMEPMVYGIGDAFGGFDEDVAANLFTVNDAEKTIVSPELTADGTIRTYADHPWINDWWNAEFVLVDGVIEYRNDSGDDPTVVEGTTGQVITYNFDDNTGTIE